jgi:ParB-like chromosome segregation protein Spo0J
MVQPQNGIEDLDMSDRSTVQSIALDRLIAHPDNPNRMSSTNFAKLVRNIEQTGRYEPLIVRPCRKRHRGSRIEHRVSSIENHGRFQIINGYHRWQVLKQLGYKRADVIIWDVDDDQADVLLATLNRLAGSDELSRKIALLKKLSKKMNARELSKLIPQTQGQIKRLVNLRIPKAPAKIPSDKFANPLVFFVADEQKKVIEEALSLIKHQASSLTKAEAKAETLTLIAQHFIDTNLQRYDENEDQVRPA